jgi:hypothetical protein
MTKRNDEDAPEELGTPDPSDDARHDLDLEGAGDEPRKSAEEPDDQEEVEQDPEEPDETEQLRSELERAKRTNREFLNMKSNYENTRRELRELRDQLMMVRGSTQRREEPVDDDLAEAVQAVASSDSPTDRVLREIGKELLAINRRQGDLEERQRVRIPEKDEPAVDKLMQTGEFRSRKAAYRAHLGDRLMELRRQRSKIEAQPKRVRDSDEEREPRREERRPVATSTRGVGRREAVERNLSVRKYTEMMNSGKPELEQAAYKAFKENRVVPG